MNPYLKEWLSIMHKNKLKIIISIIFLSLAIIIFAITGNYVTDYTDNVVSPDLILDNFGPYDLTFIYVYFFIIVMSIFFIYPLIFKPNELPYVMNMFSLFIIVRSIFIIFTHLRSPYDAIPVVFPGFFQLFNYSNDLFFSGHTGLPFLGFLIFNKHKVLRYFMLLSSILLGITVILMHIHYSIDVFSAFFITYCIYLIGDKYFK